MSVIGLHDVKALPVVSLKPVDIANKKKLVCAGNVSGRCWKRRDQKRASTFMRNDGNGTGGSGASVSWSEKQSRKRRREEVKQLENDLKEEKRQAKIEARRRREERAALRAANEFKGTTMQTLSKTHKLKTMNKKQLRMIKKTAINAETGQLELVSPWKK